MKDSSSLPDLRMLPTKMLIPHEDCDPRRVDRLSQRLREEGRLKNPPIVAQIPGSESFVVLDGATRAMAFSKLGTPHVVAQLVSYEDPGVELDTWHHVVSGMPLEDLTAALDSVSGVNLRVCSLEEARQALLSEKAAAYIVCENLIRGFYYADGQPRRDLHLLKEIVWAYKGQADIYRASNDIWDLQAPYYPDIVALVIFPRLAPHDIMRIVQRGERLPTGITRHIIPNRAVNIQIPLQVLEADWSLDRKKEWLRKWMLDRIAANAIRYYSESTFYFDE